MRPDHKQFCPTIAPPGFNYAGYDNGKYLFLAGGYQSGFKLMQCLDEDLTVDNLAFMAKHQLTRV